MGTSLHVIERVAHIAPAALNTCPGISHLKKVRQISFSSFQYACVIHETFYAGKMYLKPA